MTDGKIGLTYVERGNIEADRLGSLWKQAAFLCSLLPQMLYKGGIVYGQIYKRMGEFYRRVVV